jgi:hypothetical protein
VGELWEEVKPGLSSYAERPEDGAKSILQLVHVAQGYMPMGKFKEIFELRFFTPKKHNP